MEQKTTVWDGIKESALPVRAPQAESAEGTQRGD